MKKITLVPIILSIAISSSLYAADNADLAKQLSNPVADLVSVPFQFNYDQNIGADEETERYQLNIQPVIPIK